MKTSITINGAAYAADVEPRTLLVQFLRDNANLIGTHTGCETSQCGACTVLLDGEPVKSCTVLAVQADGHAVTTVEGLAPAGFLHPVQAAFWEKGGLQCGYCTAGMLNAVVSLLQENPNPTDDEIRHGLEGNICRCTGYQGIVDSVRLAAEKIAAGGAFEPVKA
ncbi:MAG: (2Fe-2S)-binding protein [Thermomicrobiales bacterium]|nr:(2Fe-2S)-binding protein [Thermomicrobiales bacterium]